ncbi:MAG: hypothetical protein M3Z10_06985 [Gemmatimonadota bacterium]|nr:hypothetical protein [Gemmatimonadota bacterium]
MRIHTVLAKRAIAGRLFHLLEAHALADGRGGESNEPAVDRPLGTKVKPVEARVERAARDARTRRIAFERSALLAEFHNLASNCAPS